ncbi:MAG: TIR domain-containing protein [Thermodesulfobacteriota bacterium]
MAGLTRKDFLNALYSAYFQAHMGYLAVKSTTNWYAKTEPLLYSDLSLLAGQRFAIDRDVYFSACPLERMAAQEDQIRHLTALWANLDIGKEGHRGSRHYPGRAEAAYAIGQFPLAPSAVVDSGQGYHLYWMLDDVVEVSSPGPITDLLAEISLFFQGDPQTDPATKLRLPQTFNNKVKGAPVPCLVMKLDPSLRYHIKDFEGIGAFALSRGLATEIPRVFPVVSVAQSQDSDHLRAMETTGELRLEDRPQGSNDAAVSAEPGLGTSARPIAQLEDRLVPLPGEGPDEVEITDEFPPFSGDLSESGSIGKQAITLEHSLEKLASELRTEPGRQSTPRKRTEFIDPDDVEVQKILEVEEPSVVITREDLSIDEDSGSSGETQITAELDGTTLDDDPFTDTDSIATQGIDFEAVESILADTSIARSHDTQLGADRSWRTSSKPEDNPVLDWGDDEAQEEGPSSADREEPQREDVPRFELPTDEAVESHAETGSEPARVLELVRPPDPEAAEEVAGALSPSPQPAQDSGERTGGAETPAGWLAPFVIEEGFGNLDEEDTSVWDGIAVDEDTSLATFRLEEASEELPSATEQPLPVHRDETGSQGRAFWASIMRSASPEDSAPVEEEPLGLEEANPEPAPVPRALAEPPKPAQPGQTRAALWQAVPWNEEAEPRTDARETRLLPSHVEPGESRGATAWRDAQPPPAHDFGEAITSARKELPQSAVVRFRGEDRIGPADPLSAAFQREQGAPEPIVLTAQVTESVPPVIPVVATAPEEEATQKVAPVMPGVPPAAAPKSRGGLLRSVGSLLSRIGSMFRRKTELPAAPGNLLPEPSPGAQSPARRTLQVWDRNTQTQAPVSLICGGSFARLFKAGENIPLTKSALIRPGRSFSGEPMEVFEGARKLVMIPLPKALQNRGAGARVRLTVRHSGQLLEVEVADPDSDWEREYRLSLPGWDHVDCTVRGPKAAGPGDTFTIQVHFDPVSISTSPSGEVAAHSFPALEMWFGRRSTLSAHLLVEGAEIPQPVQDRTWEGEATSCEFTVALPRMLKAGRVAGRVIVSEDSVPLGQVEFSLDVDAEAESTQRQSRPIGEGVRFTNFSVVSAWEDRAEVRKKATELTLLGKSFPEESLRLPPDAKAGSGWKTHVDECDAVLLFWSPNAADSPQLIEEYRYARETKAARIVPILLGGASFSELPQDLLGIEASSLVSDSGEGRIGELSGTPPERTGKGLLSEATALRKPEGMEARLPVSFLFGNMVRTLVRAGAPIPSAVSVRLKIPKSGSESKSLKILEGNHLVEAFTLAELREMIPQSERVTLSLQHFGKVLFVQFKAEASPLRRNYHLPLPYCDEIGIEVCGPARVRAGETFPLEVFVAGIPEESAAGEIPSKRNPAEQEPAILRMGAIRGSIVGFHLLMRGFDVREPMKEITWQGQPESVSFAVGAPSEAAGGVTGILKVTLNSVPVGHVRFRVQVTAPGEPLGIAGRTETQASPFRRFLFSFASEDRGQVAKRLQVLQLAGIRIEEELLALSPEDRWNRKWYEHIDETDAVLLFWSRHAHRSQWVLKECLHALNRKGIDNIIPVILERPIPAFPSQLADLSLDERILKLGTSDR